MRERRVRERGERGGSEREREGGERGEREGTQNSELYYSRIEILAVAYSYNLSLAKLHRQHIERLLMTFSKRSGREREGGDRVR